MSASTALRAHVRRATRVVVYCGWRCLAIAGVVGTILTAINQGDVIVTGDASPSLAWKIPLNYLTPFVVSTLGYRAAAHAGAGLIWRCGRRAARCRPAAASSRLAASARRKGSG